jgi:hypothetical protein
MRKVAVVPLGLLVAAWIATACARGDEAAVRVAQSSSSAGEVFFPTWSTDLVPKAGVSGILVERDECLFTQSMGADRLVLWQEGYSFAEGRVLDPSGQPIVRVGEALHGVGGYMSGWRWAEEFTGTRIPARCRPTGDQPMVMLYGVEPGPLPA